MTRRKKPPWLVTNGSASTHRPQLPGIADGCLPPSTYSPKVGNIRLDIGRRSADGLRLYQEYTRAAFASPDAKEGLRAFAERRDPDYGA